ncbi:ImmA/IrrE family metallo-endopeptidase [Brevundimonas sp.]|uniref:ImmA/IrrE family metallo-endopeptidase n=1 Tax=Brevundimonas sp. TaxID=1871086 RepID=UPI003521F5D6
MHNDSHHLHRQRSNICHELAHLFLGHESAPPLTEDGDRHHDGDIEAEANFLSGCLLLTNEGANHVLKHGLASQARHTYGISQPMLEYRLRVSGATTIHRRRSAAA